MNRDRLGSHRRALARRPNARFVKEIAHSGEPIAWSDDPADQRAAL
ncbi:hypothetical protein AOX55_00004929 (plasmid) [Sinorhizobium fredii CCBAU 25509]|nr:hypothetical protein AOX55_00004929 [Sinorhizobium fredii CCBAU 25509]